MIDDDFIALLECPADGSPLQSTTGGDLYCPACTAVYPVRDGIASFICQQRSSWDEVYDHGRISPPTHDYRLLERLSYFSGELDGMSFETVVEIGCGCATLGQHLLANGRACRYLGIDYALSALRRVPQTPGLQVLHGDVRSLPFRDNCADLVLSFGVLMYFDNWQEILTRLLEMLKPGGTLLLAEGVRKERSRLWTALAKLANRGSVPQTSVMDATALRDVLALTGSLSYFRSYESPFKVILHRTGLRLGFDGRWFVPLMTGADRIGCSMFGTVLPDLKGRGVIAVFHKPS